MLYMEDKNPPPVVIKMGEFPILFSLCYIFVANSQFRGIMYV